MISKTYDSFLEEFEFFYEGSTDTPGLFERPVFAAVLRCTDRDGDVQEYRDPGTIFISQELDCSNAP